MAVLQDVNINVYAQPSEKRVRTFLALSQNENGRRICFRILGAPLPPNCSATFSGTKPDGTVYTTTGTVAGNFVIVKEDVQMTAVPGVWDANLDVVNGTHNIVTAIIRVMVERGAVAPGSVPSNSQLDGYVAQCKSYAEQARMEAYGSPLTAETKAQMTDHKRAYVYTGSEPNMVAGNWYYWNGSAWTSGGVYNAVAVQTDKTLTVQDKAADGKATGDALNALKEDLNKIEPGLSEEAKAALLICFQHVAWTSHDGQTYYNALEEALYKGEILLESISASYASTGHVVYPWTAVDSLKQYITVTATYSDGSAKTISDYLLTGELNSATSTLTITYQNKSTTLTIPVVIDSALMYYTPSGTVLDGSDTSGFDTGVKLADTNKAISIIADITDEEELSRIRTIFFLNDRDSSSKMPAYGIYLSSSASGEAFQKKYHVMVGSQISNTTVDLSNDMHRIKIAIIHAAGDDNYKLYLNVDGVVVFDFITSPTTFITSEQTLNIGKRADGGYNWHGTINTCAIYSRTLTDDEARTLLGVA